MKLTDYAWSLDRCIDPPVLLTPDNFKRYMADLASIIAKPQSDLFSFFSINKAGMPLYNFYLVGSVIGVCYIKAHEYREVGNLNSLFWQSDDLPSYLDICRILKLS